MLVRKIKGKRTVFLLYFKTCISTISMILQTMMYNDNIQDKLTDMFVFCRNKKHLSFWKPLTNTLISCKSDFKVK